MTTADTRITTSRVLAAIDALESKTFTTYDVAAAMRVPEYPVRSAIAWLVKSGTVKRTGCKKLWTTPVRRIRCQLIPGKSEPYFATVYIRVMESAFDYDALYRALCGIRSANSE